MKNKQDWVKIEISGKSVLGLYGLISFTAGCFGYGWVPFGVVLILMVLYAKF